MNKKRIYIPIDLDTYRSIEKYCIENEISIPVYIKTILKNFHKYKYQVLRNTEHTFENMLLKTLNEMNEFLYHYFDVPATTNVEKVKCVRLTKFIWLDDILEIYNITELIKVLYETDKLKRTTFSNDEKMVISQQRLLLKLLKEKIGNEEFKEIENIHFKKIRTKNTFNK
jgi:hypothetical protein